MNQAVKDCFNKGQLRRVDREQGKVDNSLKQSRKYLERAKGTLSAGYSSVSFLMSYNSMFHSARAILFDDGVKERSHYCLVQYLKYKFKGKNLLSYINILDNYRQDRHKVQYGGSDFAEEEAEQAVKDAEEFLDMIKEILNL